MLTEQEKLKKAFEDTIWMAARYARGRRTYAPTMVRNSVRLFKEVFPEWEMRPDHTIWAEECPRMEADNLGPDWLDNIYPITKQND